MLDETNLRRCFLRLLNPKGRLCLFLMLLPLMAVGCATTTALEPEPAAPVKNGTQTEELLRARIQNWLGTPHRMGGLSQGGIDCSGLVVVLYDDLFGMHLPRTTKALMHKGGHVEKAKLSAGDLVFFKPKRKGFHVGIYLGQGEFVHTSTRNGVMVSRMDDYFWRQCYLTSRRLL